MANNTKLAVEQESKVDSTIAEGEDVAQEPSIEEESESDPSNGIENGTDREQPRRSSHIEELLQSMQDMALSAMDADDGELLASLAELLQDVQEEQVEQEELTLTAAYPPTRLPWLPSEIVRHILEMVPQVPRIVALSHRGDHVRMGEHNHMEVNSTTSWSPQPAILAVNRITRRVAVTGHGMDIEKAFGYEVKLATIVTLWKKHLWVQFGIDTIYIADRESGLHNIGETLANGTHLPQDSMLLVRSLALDIDHITIPPSHLVIALHRYPNINELVLVVRLGPCPSGLKGEMEFMDIDSAEKSKVNAYLRAFTNECVKPSAETRKGVVGLPGRSLRVPAYRIMGIKKGGVRI